VAASTSGGVSELTLAVVAGGFTVLGVGLKMLFDHFSERARNRRELERDVLPARREAYEAFIQAERRERAYIKSLEGLLARHRAGESEMSQEEQDSFPASPMPDMVEALRRIERVAGDYSVIQAGQNIVRLFGDMATALKRAITAPSPNDEIVWFLLQRFEEDREREFVFAYRKDLGLGTPVGAPTGFPMQSRPWPLGDAEAIVRTHMRGNGSGGAAKAPPLT